MTEKQWETHVAFCVGHYPLMATDWDAHRRGIQLAAPVPDHLLDAVPYFDVEPMSEEEEEYAAATAQTALQMELF